MSYDQAMKWNRKHSKGTRQPVLMSTGSGFWPSSAFLEEEYFPYVEGCKKAGMDPIPCEEFYNDTLRGRIMSDMNTDQRVEYTRLRPGISKDEEI